MESAIPPPSNRNPRKTKNVFQIGGIPVEFPYQPYGSQLAFMGRIISTLDRAQRNGHCHALLESPTGTGKSLSLLCSVLSWQQNQRSKFFHAKFSHSKPAPEAFTDPMGHGGGFVPELDAAANTETSQTATNRENVKKKVAPTIFYASRTHSQISQVVREYRKTAYRVPMAVLASRKHYCTNKHLRGKDNIDEQCKILLKTQGGCSEFKYVHKVKGHPSLQKGGCHEAHDIEDLVKIGEEVKGCSYFAARSMAEDAQLVFCPYSYIINPVIRRAMEVDLKGAIVILDEAHNIEDISRDAGSTDIEEDVLLQLQTELGQLSNVDAMTYQPLYEMLQDIISWIDRRKDTLENHEFQHYFSCWTGDKALRELQEANITQQCFPIMQECATKAIKAASDAEQDSPVLSGMSATMLEGLFSSLSYFFSENGLHIFDYQLVLRRYIKRDAGNFGGELTCSMSLWCLNPAVVFKDIADLSLSVILTSGTLSPMNSFSSELGVQFGTCLEAPHVIDVESQLWTAVIPSGPDNHPLNASYKTADALAFQDSLGKSLEEICKVVPGGCLIFFPSYKLMEKLSKRWHETGQWLRLNAHKSLFAEPRGGNQDDFDSVLKNYYNSIRYGAKPLAGKKRRGKRLGLTNRAAVVCTEVSEHGGAAFLAVCRGKVSEGIDFSDDNARVVIIVGIPFPNTHDIQVAQKKKYNDTYRSSKNLLGGSEWYCQQAFRALNQAAGRCIRHRFDYGAIILLDERFREERNTSNVSKWLRRSLRNYDNFDKSVEGLKSFFKDVKDRVNTAVNASQKPQVAIDDISSTNQSKGFIKSKIQKVSKPVSCGQKVLSNINGVLTTGKNPSWSSLHCDEKYGPSCTLRKPQVTASLENGKVGSCQEYTDQKYNFEKDSGFCSAPSAALFPGDLEVSMINQTLVGDITIPVASPESVYKREEFPSSTFNVPPPNAFQDETWSLPNSDSLPQLIYQLATPKRDVNANSNNLYPDPESASSVNSHSQKRRKLPLLTQLEAPQFECRTPGEGSSVTIANGNLGDYKIKCSENALTTSELPMDQKMLKIHCSECKNALGLSRNNMLVTCWIITLSKMHLVSLWNGITEVKNDSSRSSVTVLMTDVSSVDERLCKNTAKEEGIWCREDGCVFNSIMCPFCSSCVGVQVMATDSLNVHLLNKMLFNYKKLEIVNREVAKDNGEVGGNSKSAATRRTIEIEKFSYSPPQHNLPAGFRKSKSKMSLPKK